MSVGELILVLIACSIPCFLVAKSLAMSSPIPEKYHDDLGFVCIVALLFLAFSGAMSALRFGSTTSGISAAALADVFVAFASVMAFRRCRKKETRISGSFFLFVAGYIIYTLVRSYY